MPRTKKQMADHARSTGRAVEAAESPLRFEEIRERLRVAGLCLSVKQARRTLELAERGGLVARVNRSRWGRVGSPSVVSTRRPSRVAAVIGAAALLLELPPSAELNRALRGVLRLASEPASAAVRSSRASPPGPVHCPPDLGASRGASPARFNEAEPLGKPAEKSNGASDAANEIEVRLDAHA